VAKGETLFRISKKYGVTVAQLQQWNNKGNSTTIFPGEQLRVAAQAANPAQTSTAAAASSDLAARTGAAVQTYTGSDASRLASDDIHVAAPGETVASVALRYGYTEARFRQLNNLSPTQVLRVGQVLRTSDCPTDAPAPAPAAQPSGGIPATTLSSFPAGMTPRSPTAVPTEMSTDDARRPRTEMFYYNLFDSDRPSFRDLNTPNFTNGAAPSAAPTSTTVTPRGIPSPAEYNAMPASRASSQAMPVDLEAFLPRSYDAPAPQQPVAQSQRPTTDRAFYVVQQGDSLYRIARMYGVTVEHLCAVNDFSPREAIIPGQKIFIQ
jgi:LysM repeat protein